MTIKVLGLKERAVLETIISQRIDSEGDIIEYDFDKAREHLNRNNKTKQYFTYGRKN